MQDSLEEDEKDPTEGVCRCCKKYFPVLSCMDKATMTKGSEGEKIQSGKESDPLVRYGGVS